MKCWTEFDRLVLYDNFGSICPAKTCKWFKASLPSLHIILVGVLKETAPRRLSDYAEN